MLRYTLLRTLVFLGCLLVGWLLGLRSRNDALLLVVGAALVSMAISYVVLRPMREEYSEQIAHRIEDRAARREAHVVGDSDEADEDREDEAGYR